MKYSKVTQYGTKVTWSETERFQEMETETELKTGNHEKWKSWKLETEMETKKELKRDGKISEIKNVDHL